MTATKIRFLRITVSRKSLTIYNIEVLTNLLQNMLNTTTNQADTNAQMFFASRRERRELGVV